MPGVLSLCSRSISLLHALSDGVITAGHHRLLAEALSSCEETRRNYVELIELQTLLELGA